MPYQLLVGKPTDGRANLAARPFPVTRFDVDGFVQYSFDLG
jgi:hypothetical protein